MSGMAALRRKRELQARKAQMGQELAQETTEKLQDAMSTFKSNLEQFALQHKEAIRADPEFRAHFHAMCTHAGVDPLASNKAYVNKMLDFRDWNFASFYYELGVTVVEVCMMTRPQNGGLIELRQLTQLVQVRRGNAVDKISSDDVLQAVKRLRVLDASFKVIPDPKTVRSVSDTTFYINSVPREVDTYLQDALEAARGKGYVTKSALAKMPTWSEQRAQLVLDAMIQDGTCMIDDGDPCQGRLYWFPVLREDIF